MWWWEGDGRSLKTLWEGPGWAGKAAAVPHHAPQKVPPAIAQLEDFSIPHQTGSILPQAKDVGTREQDP